MKKALPEAMAASDPATRADVFWVRTFLATSLRIGDTASRDLAVREGVGPCPHLRADERTLIREIVAESRRGRKPDLVGRGASRDDAEAR